MGEAATNPILPCESEAYVEVKSLVSYMSPLAFPKGGLLSCGLRKVAAAMKRSGEAVIHEDLRFSHYPGNVLP